MEPQRALRSASARPSAVRLSGPTSKIAIRATHVPSTPHCLLGLRINSRRRAVQARSAKWNEAPVVDRCNAPGPANRHQLVGPTFHHARRRPQSQGSSSQSLRRCSPKQRLDGLKIGKYAPPLLSCLCRTGLWAVWRMRGNADFCEFAKAYALCASCAYNHSDANLFAVGQTVGQPARTVVDISDRPHAAAATHIRIPGQRFCPDTEEVTGSNPVSPTSNIPSQRHFLDRASGIRATNAQQGRA